jgi:hypothetical protein
MSFLVSDLKNDLTRKGHGTTTDDLRDVDGLINEGARQLLMDVDPPETERISELPNALFDDVFRTASPADLKGKSIIDIRPQVGRTEADNFTLVYSQPFDLRKSIANNELAIEQDDGVAYIRINKKLNKGILLNECDSLTANGAWTAGGSATNLALDNVYFASGSASLSFDVGVGTNHVENTSMSAIDLTTHVKQASIFVWIYIPSAFDTTKLTNVNLIWGSDTSANYYSNTVTANFDSTAFQTGWNLLQFPWNGLTPTGSPTVTAYDSLRLTLTTTGTGTGFKVDSFYSKLPSIYEIQYYSNYLFRTSAGAFSLTVTDDTDTINVNSDGYQLLLKKCKQLAAEDRGGKDAMAESTATAKDYMTSVLAYNTKYPSKVLPEQTFYYRIRK